MGWGSIRDSILRPIDPITGRGAKKAGQDAARAAEDASRLSADYQQQALDFLRDQSRLPTEARDQALTQLSNMTRRGTVAQHLGDQSRGYQQEILGAGQEAAGGYGAGADQYNQALSGLGLNYENAIMGGLDRSIAGGEEAILRRQAATGGLRSGDTQGALADRAMNMRMAAERDVAGQQLGLGLQGAGAVYDAGNMATGTILDTGLRATGVGMDYDQTQRNLVRQNRQDRLNELGTLAGLNTNAGSIANMTSGIGQTLAQGMTGAAQARVMGMNQQAAQQLGLLNAGASIGTKMMGAPV